MSDSKTKGPLEGFRVLELGQLLAGPFTTSILGYFGAEVIKIEPPGTGDPIRTWRVMKDGVSLWWHSLGRNKKCITVNLRTERGRELVRQLAAKSDILVENFRPGTMEKWGLGPDDLRKSHPELIYARISGYGQTGPYASRTGFASVCEGVGGFRYVNGFPGQAPVRPNLSLGDTLAAVHSVIGILLACVHRLKGAGNRGQVIDTAIYEAVFNMMEGIVPEYSGAGVVREPSGSTLTGIVPTNTYRCKDGRFVIIGGNGDSIYKRLMSAIGRADLANDPRMADNAGRVRHEKELDTAISAWTSTLASGDVLAVLDRVDVPAGPIYSVVDMMNDEHFKARGLFEQVEVRGETMTIPAMVPFLSDTPGRTEWPGPEIGAHNQEIFGKLLGYGTAEIEALRRDGII
ncbi:MAG: putative L-carnitine dehydratase [Gammaproteobacteria bacterium]|nr:MAG: CoA transferase [Pseudomonadota bacterium]MBC6943897.1 CoA transferase [Gammaproteobacteria bacterium]MCE7895299.1 CoA transferase [Gammaproteobacteria bacterium PRO8]MDL1880215.1 CoA transferase [Gammaproteobacteria bacterium PRO2]MCQ3933770.1 CoA transferase [Gammaproteobacteria bacterium]